MISPLKITSVLLLLLALCSCEEHYNIDGRILSRHGVAIPNAVVKMRIAEGARSCCERTVFDTTDMNGTFLFTGSFGFASREYAWNVESSVKDSGFAEMRGIPNRSHVILQLK